MNVKEPLISIVMVNYNHEDYIEDAISSVVAQTYKNWELIIVDDGSTDSSPEIIEKYETHDPRIKAILQRENRHICIATNIGFRHVNGEFVARIDSDDVWHPEKLARQIKHMWEHPEAGLCFTKLDIIDENDAIVNESHSLLYQAYNGRKDERKGWIRHFFFYGNTLIQSTLLMKREVLDNVGGFNLAYIQGHDFDFFVRAIMKYEFTFLETPLVKYRRMENQNSAWNDDNNRRFFNEHMSIRLRFFKHMSDELFKEVFKDDFINSDSSTHEELLCEQAFLLMKCMEENDLNPVLGLMKLEDLLNCPETCAVLEEKYQFTPKVFYEENKKKQYYSPDLYREERALRKELEKMKEINKNQKDHIELLLSIKDQQQRAIEEMQNSFSWKVTKPIRNLRGKRGRVDK